MVNRRGHKGGFWGAKEQTRKNTASVLNPSNPILPFSTAGQIWGFACQQCDKHPLLAVLAQTGKPFRYCVISCVLFLNLLPNDLLQDKELK